MPPKIQIIILKSNYTAFASKNVFKSNLQLFQYTRQCITPNRVMSCGAHLCVIIPVGNIANLDKMEQQWLAVCNTVSDLISTRFEPRTSRAKDKRIRVWYVRSKVQTVLFSLFKSVQHCQRLASVATFCERSCVVQEQ